MIDSGAKLDTFVSKRFSCLHLAAEIKDTRILAKLLEKAPPALLSEKNSEGASPLMSASGSGNLDNINLLIEYGGDLWAQSEVKMNSFDIMAATGQTEALK